MYDYEEGMTKCQNEIRRLRNVVRADEEEIARLKVLLRNAIEYIAESTDSLSEIGTEEQREWYEETLGITAEELKSIGLDWFREEPEDDDRSEMPWDYGKHFD